MRFHLDLKMLPVIEALSQKVSLQVFPCHSDTTHSEGLKYLDTSTPTLVQPEWQTEPCAQHLGQDLPFLCDLGGDMICWAIEENIPVKGALEGTTSGLLSLRELSKTRPPAFPILNWNDARLKKDIHNEKMVGFSLWHTFTQLTQLSLHGKTVGVFGFGPVGRGIARQAKTMGGQVLVYDPDPQSLVTAKFEGMRCPGREAVLAESQILVTATGSQGVLDLDDLTNSPDGVLLVNAGHSERELAPSIREAAVTHQALPHVDEISIHSKKSAYLLAGGRLLNLAAGFGDTINAFDLTSAQLVDALNILITEHQNYRPGLQDVPGDFFQLSS